MANESDSLLRVHEEERSLARRRTASLLIPGFIILIVLVAASVSPENRFFFSKHLIDSIVDPEDHDASPAPRYKATQFISFTINTLGGLDAHGECKDRSVDENGVCYLGNSNITEDMDHRYQIVMKVLDRLKQDVNQKHPEVDHREDVLKIFSMPEFFWRGPNGAYTASQIFGDDLHNGGLLHLSDRLYETVKDEAFSDYLFLFGTVIGVKEALDGKNLEYINFCPVFKGGPQYRRYIVPKKYISLVDFLNREVLPNPRTLNVSEYKHNDFSDRFHDLLKERGTDVVSDNVLYVDGVKIGIEICLDHRMGVLWEKLQQHHDSELVDVQVITSAGMAIERGPNPIVPGGVVYLSDGEASSAACLRSDTGDFDPDKVCRAVGPNGRKHFPQGGPHYSEFFTMSACLDTHRIEFLEGYFSLYQTQGCAYTLKLYGINVMDQYEYYPPSLEIYPTVDLPKLAYA
jgi:hypothetical protein